jgi:hypothetical protein
MAEKTRIELARESGAADLKRFVDELGLRAHRDGTVIEILDASDAIGYAVTAWLAEWHETLVPTELEDRAVGLRPPAA